ncbi:MAG: RNA-binding S4 domain-containing protein [Bacteroidales bacterium]|nr:RNA-binding S4 domain-containing protein [Bacteroidales bacterium]
MDETLRIDKWLWAVRVFKTRSQAGAACRAGRVKSGDHPVKPSREVHPGDIFTVHDGGFTRTLKVLTLLHNRVGAKWIGEHMEDLTPPEEYEKMKVIRERNHEFRPRGLGRPTKKERRMIDRLKG